jgi:hypothetical protein
MPWDKAERSSDLGVSYTASRGSPSTRNRNRAYSEPRWCECRLDWLMVLRLFASPPAWEYEPGSFTASSLVTPSPQLALGARSRGSRLKEWFLTLPTPPASPFGRVTALSFHLRVGF